MDLLFKILKISGLLILIVVLAVLFAPTLKGPFVVIHFSTALRGWLLAQLVLVSFAMAAHALFAHLLTAVSSVPCFTLPTYNAVARRSETMRC